MIHRMLRISALAVAASLLLPGLALAENQIQSISSTIQGGNEIIRIDFKDPVTEQPRAFGVQSPPRIALDFQDVSSQLPSSLQEMNQGNLRSYQLAHSGKRARLILNL